MDRIWISHFAQEVNTFVELDAYICMLCVWEHLEKNDNIECGINLWPLG